mmetsp:Transcript_33728/g.56647  ORF Transcript_33728/g.56647 Transcript_33728/m.56647 type:complete len:421 (+) Transcript_33728:103-1365(+)
MLPLGKTVGLEAFQTGLGRLGTLNRSSRTPPQRTPQITCAIPDRQRPQRVVRTKVAGAGWGARQVYIRQRITTPIRDIFRAVKQRREQLQHLTLDKLKPLLRQRGLSITGRKTDLIERIISDEASVIQRSAPMETLHDEPALRSTTTPHVTSAIDELVDAVDPAIDVLSSTIALGGRAPVLEFYPVVDGETMRKVDIEVAERLKIVRTCEAVAHRTADFVAYELAVPLSTQLVFLAGKGNNGQNAIATARALHGRGYKTSLVLAAEEEALSSVLREQIEIYRAFGGQVSLSLPSDLSRSVVIDGLLGHGIASAPRGRVAELINQVNGSSSRAVVALDLPSGLNHVTGRGYVPTMRASHTLVYHVAKSGNVAAAAREFSGAVYVTETALTFPAFGAQISAALQEQFRQGPLVRLKLPDVDL